MELLDLAEYSSDKEIDDYEAAEKEEVGEKCEMCKRYLLFNSRKGEKVCINCHNSILIGEVEREINFENKNKQLNNFFKALCFHTLTDEIVHEAAVFLDNKFAIDEHGLTSQNTLVGRKYKLKKWSQEKVEKHICKWVKEYCKNKLFYYSVSLESELINRVYGKPFLTKKQMVEINNIFNDYLKFLQEKHLNPRINYKLFFSQVFKLLNYESLALCAPIQDKKGGNF